MKERKMYDKLKLKSKVTQEIIAVHDSGGGGGVGFTSTFPN